MKKILLITVMVCLVFSGTASAETVLDFDDIGTTTSHDLIGNYKGFSFSGNFRYMKNSYRPGSGYDIGTVSDDYAAFNAQALDVSLSSAKVFNFKSAYFTAALLDNAEIRIKGFLGKSEEYSRTITIHDYIAKEFVLDFDDIDRVSFESLASNNGHFVMDNMIVTPEPVSTVLFLVGGIPMAVGLYRKRKQA